MAELRKETSQEMGLHEEQLKGRTQKKFFSIDESENLTYFHSFDVDTSKSATIDALDMTPREINREIRELMEKGIGDITVDNPMSRHGVGVGILNRLNLTFSDSLGYFGCGLIDGPNVHIKGRVGWSCAENMMAGTVVIDKNAGSTFGAAIRGGDLVCKGSVGARTGIDQKGGTIIVPPFISIPVLAPTLPLQTKSPPRIAAPKHEPAFFSITTFPAIIFSAQDQPTLPLILTVGPSHEPMPK